MGAGDLSLIFAFLCFHLLLCCCEAIVAAARCCYCSMVYKSRAKFHFFFSRYFYFFFKKDFHTQNFHIPAFQCVETVVPMYHVSACNEGECVVDIQYRRGAYTGRSA